MCVQKSHTVCLPVCQTNVNAAGSHHYNKEYSETNQTGNQLHHTSKEAFDVVKDDSNHTGNMILKTARTRETSARQMGADSEVPPATKVTWEDYARAERFLPQNIGKLAFRLEVTPN